MTELVTKDIKAVILIVFYVLEATGKNEHIK